MQHWQILEKWDLRCSTTATISNRSQQFAAQHERPCTADSSSFLHTLFQRTALTAPCSEFHCTMHRMAIAILQLHSTMQMDASQLPWYNIKQAIDSNEAVDQHSLHTNHHVIRSRLDIIDRWATMVTSRLRMGCKHASSHQILIEMWSKPETLRN